MIFASFLDSLIYIMSDQYFLLSMAATVMIGIFLGATLYNGLLNRLWKALISLSSYGLLMVATTSTRVIPMIEQGVFERHHPFSGVVQLSVSVFYFYMTIGVLLLILLIKEKTMIDKRFVFKQDTGARG